MDKLVVTAREAVADITDGASLAVGGFGLCGVPYALITALYENGASEFSVVSNNCGVNDLGLGVLLSAGRTTRVTGSYVGENSEFARQYLAGELELELCPQGSLAERLRAGGVGIPAFYTPAGVGTMIAEGGMPWRYDANGGVAALSPAKEVRRLNDGDYVLETRWSLALPPNSPTASTSTSESDYQPGFPDTCRRMWCCTARTGSWALARIRPKQSWTPS